MKVLHINLWDIRGGAAVAASRLHSGLLNIGVDSTMLVERSCGSLPMVETVTTGLEFQMGRIMERATIQLGRLQRDKSLFASSLNLRPNRLLRRIREINPDIVHLHWVGGGMLRLTDLPRIRQPIVWTMHDMWPFCGSEHYNLDEAERWAHCYNKQYRPVTARGLDLTSWTWQRKHRLWRKVSLTTVSPSRWMQNCAVRSSLWEGRANCRHLVIPNGLDDEIFKPSERQAARKALNLPDDLPLLLFGAFSLASHVKGGDLLLPALLKAREKQTFRIVTFGGGELESLKGIEQISLGRIEDTSQLAKLYSAADLMVVPSRLESFGQTASESLACGTPVVCFDTSGLKDIVDHKINGYRAAVFDVDDLAKGIGWCLEKSRFDALSLAARKKVLASFRIRDCALRHNTLYRDLLENKSVNS